MATIMKLFLPRMYNLSICVCVFITVIVKFHIKHVFRNSITGLRNSVADQLLLLYYYDYIVLLLLLTYDL